MRKEYRIYKPRKSNDGAASIINISQREMVHNDKKYIKTLVFWKSANQSGVDERGNAQFHWENPEQNVNIKLGLPDISEILCVLRGIKQFVGMPPKNSNEQPRGLYHKNPLGNSALKFQINERGDGYYVGVSAQRNGQLVTVKHSLTLAEGEILRILLEAAVLELLS
jgi:hypothetical protein